MAASYEAVKETFERANAEKEINPAAAVTKYRSLLELNPKDDPEKIAEQALVALGEVLVAQGDAGAIVELFEVVKGMAEMMSKARTAKIVRMMLTVLGKVDEGSVLSVSVAEGLIEWAKETGRKFLRQRLEASLAGMYADAGEYSKSLTLLAPVLKEVKKLEDKLLLVELHLVESRVHHALRNLPKAKASLTSARTSSTAVFCPPLMQAQIESQAGVLQAEEKDYKTAYSYFFEAFEGYASLAAMPELNTEPLAVASLKYMLLCKVMMDKPQEVTSVVNNKAVLKFSGDHVTAMQAIAAAAIDRSLHKFQAAIDEYPSHLAEDPVIAAHLKTLYDSLFEANLLRIIEPYTSVQVAHIAQTIALPLDVVESKLSKMILDGKLSGVLDQDVDALIVYDEPKQDKALAASLDVIDNMSQVVDSLFNKVNNLS
ncbi:26S proteasome regulatory subunit [Thecamonas trahens ATCC 50062]|uniref:26S proteasome regulatory subunit n=1 Tax=Thecamonas trahens ATCC 50062 TaxID=461836 RepID=A0A0L0DCL9_THETB|nr:26S proteasome regulatory subunit [Thecamonas trahens ATCC 50062]KNC49995.1 26S proteasome regulatory subunit [Thecamonas trahens ATCC 50062]|eukprot:XP_013757164.1 26S proteasome regulatory subunit [Thecamonas trahens ATCC 50062]